jgi:threonine dehydratase
MIAYEDIVRARKPVYRHLQRTPLHPYPGLSELTGAEIWVKHENHQPVGAFKVRGGVHLAETLGPEERAAGLYTASTGNHGQSIAYGGRVTGTAVTVAVPVGANPDKVAAMRRLGATVIEHGADFDEAREWIAGVSAEQGGRFIGPTEPELVAAYGTYALEIFEELPDVDVILVPVGAGGGAAGCALVAAERGGRAEVIAVQAEQAPTQYLSWQAGEPREGAMNTRAEGMATRVPFENTRLILREHLADFVLVGERAMEEAVLLMLEHTHNLAEEAGAAPLAAALRLGPRIAGRKVVLVQSGGNLTVSRLAELVRSSH